MEVIGAVVLAVGPLELLLYVVLAAIGFIVVIAVCAVVLAILQIVLPTGPDPEPGPDQGEGGSSEGLDNRPNA